MTRTSEYIGALVNLIREFNSLIDEFGTEQTGKQLTKMQKVCNDFLQRMRLNTEALVPLFELYIQRRGMIQPIGLIIRSCLSDFLTFCYLVTFTHQNDKEEKSLGNELLLLEKDFVSSILKVFEYESKIHKYNADIPQRFESADAYHQARTELENMFKYLFKTENKVTKLKKPIEFREPLWMNCLIQKKNDLAAGHPS